MRRTAMLAATVVACLLAFPVVAQEGPGPIHRVLLWEIKPGAVADFEEGLAKHNAFHKEQGDPLPHHTWEIISGPNSGKYLRVASNRQWSDFDAEEAWGEADAADSAKTITPYIASGMPAYYLLKADVSRPKGDSPAPMASLIWFKVKIGQARKFDHLIERFHQAITKTNWPTHYAWFQMINGLEGPLYVLVLPHDNWADMAPPEKPFDAMLEETYGKVEAESLIEQWDSALESVRSEIIRFRKDLSYLPE